MAKRKETAYDDNLSLHKPGLSSFRTDNDKDNDFNYSQTQHSKSQVTASMQTSMQQSKFTACDPDKDSVS